MTQGATRTSYHWKGMITTQGMRLGKLAGILCSKGEPQKKVIDLKGTLLAGWHLAKGLCLWREIYVLGDIACLSGVYIACSSQARAIAWSGFEYIKISKVQHMHTCTCTCNVVSCPSYTHSHAHAHLGQACRLACSVCWCSQWWCVATCLSNN